MKIRTLCASALLAATFNTWAAGPVVGVSWANFQEERWKTDEAAIKAELNRLGATYVSADAGGSPEKQLGDVESLLAKGAKVLIIMAMDKDAIQPALGKAKARKVPVIAYDRLIEAPGVFYLSFDNREVGRLQAAAVLAVRPRGRYVMIKGSPSDPNADFLRAGQQDALAEAVKKGDVKIVAEEYTDGWRPEVAQKNTEQILTRLKGGVDAVVASADGIAGGVVAALGSRGIRGVPVSGQDADLAALNRIVLGTQTVSIWKDTRLLGKEAASAAIQLANGQKIAGATAWAGGERKVQLQAKFLPAVPITRANLDRVIDSGWVSKAVVCKGVDAANAPAACK